MFCCEGPDMGIPGLADVACCCCIPGGIGPPGLTYDAPGGGGRPDY
jgi:hypothetical protein